MKSRNKDISAAGSADKPEEEAKNMSCSTFLVGKKASYDGSTMIARNEDVCFEVKKFVVVNPQDQPVHYRSTGGHFKMDLPKNPMRYTACPCVDPDSGLCRGIWAADGINEANVGMTATETTTSNPRVLGADPLVVWQPADGEKPEVPGGIGEEDMVVIVLPYIRSAREGVLRLGSLLEQYGTSEINGIAFNDRDEVWWMETIGGHHWAARRVRDEECVFMPNRFGLDEFDFKDALGKGQDHLCSADLPEFIEKNFLNLNQQLSGGLNPDGAFSLRNIFGTQSDYDHAYNTPREWYAGRTLNPTRFRWDGKDADYGPESNDIPWSRVPEKKITVENVKAILSSHYQGTPFDPYAASADRKGVYRPVGMRDTSHLAICQIRGYLPEEIQGVEWICCGSTTFNALFPVYTNVSRLPSYLSDVTLDVSTNTLYWSSRMIGALADMNYGSCLMQIERYHNRTAVKGHELLELYDRRFMDNKDSAAGISEEANEKLCAMMQEQAAQCLQQVLQTAGEHMKNNFSIS